MRRTARSRRKLAMWYALPPYLGGKRRLCPLIFREIDRLVPRRHWSGLTFLDGFLGGGSVSLYAKAQGFKVVATDIAARAITVGQAVVANSRVRLAREDILRLLAPRSGPAGRIETQLVPSVFTMNIGRFLDAALETAAQTSDVAKAALLRLLAIRVALLSHPMSQVRPGTVYRATTGEWESITESCRYHYVEGLRLTTPAKLWEIAQMLNAGVFQGEATVIQRSILEILPEVSADVAYFDPPYAGVMSYEKEYRVIDQLLEGTTRPTSPFTAKDGAAMIDTLLECAGHIPVWLLSFGNEVTALEELEAKMTRLGRQTKAIAIKYQHLPAVAREEKKRENREFLVMGWDPEAALLRRVAGLGVGIVERDADLVVPLHADLDLGGAEGSAAESLAGDGVEEGEAAQTQQPAPDRGRSIAPLQARVDEPEPVFVEPGVDGDGEGRRLGGHDATIPQSRRGSQGGRA